MKNPKPYAAEYSRLSWRPLSIVTRRTISPRRDDFDGTIPLMDQVEDIGSCGEPFDWPRQIPFVPRLRQRGKQADNEGIEITKIAAARFLTDRLRFRWCVNRRPNFASRKTPGLGVWWVHRGRCENQPELA